MKVKLNGNDYFTVSSTFGVTDSAHDTPHSGIDLVMEIGTKLFSPIDGTISRIVDYGSNNIGKGIIIKTDSGESVIMGHLSEIHAKVGQRVGEGDFVALSGSTGNSTGGHLHLGLKDKNGNFINPEKLLNETNEGGGFLSEFIQNGQVNNYKNAELESKGFMEFINDWRSEGFFQAIYDKSFFEVTKDFIAQLLHDIGMFMLSYSEFFLLLPAISLMFATFIIGRNKYTKWIIPLWFAYFISRVLYGVLL